MRILVSGANGYIGSSLVTYLEQRGFEVFTFTQDKKRDDQRKTFYYGERYNNVPSIVEIVKPQAVIFLAAAYTDAKIEDIIDCNVLLPTKLIEAARDSGDVRFIYASTFWENGNDKIIGQPVDLYSASKKAFSTISKFYATRQGVDVIGLCLYGTYGPNDQRTKLHTQIIDAARKDEEVSLTDGFQSINMVHIKDVCYAFYKAITKDSRSISGESYSVSSSNQPSVRSLISAVESKLGKKLKVRWGALPARKEEVIRPIHLHELLPEWEESHDLSDFIVEQILR